jgi:hypothetical protein
MVHRTIRLSLVVEHMRLLGRFAHLFDRDRIEIGEKGSPALRTAGSMTRSRSTEFAPRSSGSAVLSDIAVRTISPTVMRRRSRAKRRLLTAHANCGHCRWRVERSH